VDPCHRVVGRLAWVETVFAAEVERPPSSAVVVKTTGELDLMSVPELESVLNELMAEKVDLELDVSELDFIDSTGVHLLLGAHKASVRDGWDFAITGACNEVRRAFELLGLLDHLPFRDRPQTSS
jgi:anti-sigma B factor antagonist